MATPKHGSLSVPSDTLKDLRQLCAQIPAFHSLLAGILQVRLIIDTNIVISDLLELAKPHRTPTFRTALQELLDSETVVAYVPNQQKEEIARRWPTVASEHGIHADHAERLWQSYRRDLRFCEVSVSERDGPVRDPSDLPFLDLAVLIGAHGIASKDHDIAAMGGRVVSIDFLLTLRDYSRHKAIEVTVQVGSIVVTVAALGTIVLAFMAIRGVLAGIMRLPGPLQLLLMAGILWAMANDKRRAALVALVTSGWERIAPAIAEPLGKASADMAQTGPLVQRAFREIDKHLGAQTPKPLRIHIRAVLAGEVSPLTVRDIEWRVRVAGYSTRARNFRACILRILRREPEFCKVVDGWQLVHDHSLLVGKT